MTAPTKDNKSTQEVENQVVAEVEPIEEYVVALVKTRYSIALAHNEKVTYEPGNQTMPRAHAEHWYSVNMGTQIVGVPDNQSLSGVTAQVRLKEIAANVAAQASAVEVFKAQYKDMTDSESSTISKSLNSLSKTAEALTGLLRA